MACIRRKSRERRPAGNAVDAHPMCGLKPPDRPFGAGAIESVNRSRVNARRRESPLQRAYEIRAARGNTRAGIERRRRRIQRCTCPRANEAVNRQAEVPLDANHRRLGARTEAAIDRTEAVATTRETTLQLPDRGQTVAEVCAGTGHEEPAGANAEGVVTVPMRRGHALHDRGWSQSVANRQCVRPGLADRQRQRAGGDRPQEASEVVCRVRDVAAEGKLER
jgi:hypothetical protein